MILEILEKQPVTSGFDTGMLLNQLIEYERVCLERLGERQTVIDWLSNHGNIHEIDVLPLVDAWY